MLQWLLSERAAGSSARTAGGAGGLFCKGWLTRLFGDLLEGIKPL